MSGTQKIPVPAEFPAGTGTKMLKSFLRCHPACRSLFHALRPLIAYNGRYAVLYAALYNGAPLRLPYLEFPFGLPSKAHSPAPPARSASTSAPLSVWCLNCLLTLSHRFAVLYHTKARLSSIYQNFFVGALVLFPKSGYNINV